MTKTAMKSDGAKHRDGVSSDLQAASILRKPCVLELTGLSSATLYRWMSQGLFPRPVRLGPNSVGWRESAIREWLESRELAVTSRDEVGA